VSSVADVNITTWARGGFLGSYGGRELRPVEVLLLLRYHEHASGRVVELGCGGGRIAGYLVDIAQEAYGIDISADMVEACRQRYPAGHFSQGDIRDLSQFEDGSLDLVVAGCNLLDIFGDAERRESLREIRRVLVDGGLLLMSSHNRAYLPHVRRPTHIRRSDPLRLAFDLFNAPRRMVRHRRLRSFEREEADYSIVSDGAHEFSLVHYFTFPDAQFRQFEQEGFEPLLSADLDGRPVDKDHQAPDCSEIYYVARKPPGG
jgi:SAM-dependent methyltransferase